MKNLWPSEFVVQHLSPRCRQYERLPLHKQHVCSTCPLRECKVQVRNFIRLRIQEPDELERYITSLRHEPNEQCPRDPLLPRHELDEILEVLAYIVSLTQDAHLFSEQADLIEKHD